MNVFQIHELTGGELHGAGDVEILRAASLALAVAGELSFVETWSESIETNASCLIIPETGVPETIAEALPHTSLIVVKNPKLAFAEAAAALHPPKRRAVGVHSSAVIADSAALGANSSVGAFVVIGENSVVGNDSQIGSGAQIGDNVTIGDKCTIHPNVCIEDDGVIGDGVILHAGVCLGADGFGYVRNGADGYVKFPQIGKVIIEDSVEIGANTCIDRGALGDTIVGAGTKIDNLVQIAHNVKIGKRVIIAAQTGISGSTVIEDDCVIGGQVGMGDHAKVLSGAIIGSQAGVLPGKIVRAGVWWGTPVQPLDEYKRQNAMVKSLGRLKAQVKELARRLNERDQSTK